MATNNQIIVSDLDFDQIKNNLKSYLRGQIELSDYDFEGSGLSLLLDILAYNTHYNALYTNLAVNESFLDSAIKRSSVISRAFALGYTPTSAKASTAVVEVIVKNVSENPTSLTIGKNTPFTTTLNGKNYTFYTTSAHTTNPIGANYTFSNVQIKEGTPLTKSYIVSDGMKYIIPNANCDVDTIQVTVYGLNNLDYTVYNKVDDILNVKSTDPIFFIKEIENNNYELQFGNGQIGQALANGERVVINYMVTNKGVANGCRIFNFAGGFDGVTVGATVTNTTTMSYGGAEPETIDSIKFAAPRLYNAVNRAVTVEDYKTIVQKYYQNIDSINVWSGAENNPPVYGKVFLSIKPSNETILSPAVKTLIKDEILKSRSMVTITPEFVDPFYLNLALNVTIYYDPKTTTKTTNDLETLVRAAIINYNNTELKRFDSVFRYSKFIGMIDDVDVAIKSNITTLAIRRPVSVKFNTAAKYTFHIDNPIYTENVPEDAVTSTGFYVSGSSEIQYLYDDGYGTIIRYYNDSNNNRIITNANQGTVVYSTGEITLNDLTITRLASSNLELILKPQSNDVISVREHIVQIDMTKLTINSVVDTISAGNAYGGTNYTFTASR